MGNIEQDDGEGDNSGGGNATMTNMKEIRAPRYGSLM